MYGELVSELSSHGDEGYAFSPEVPPEKTAPSTNVSDEDHVHGDEEHEHDLETKNYVHYASDAFSDGELAADAPTTPSVETAQQRNDFFKAKKLRGDSRKRD